MSFLFFVTPYMFALYINSMKRPYFSHIVNKATKTAKISIYGDIGWDDRWWGGTNNESYELVRLISRLEKTNDRINVHINSPGGSITEGLAIYNALKNSKADIHTYNDGITASMAGIIMLAGTSHMPKTSVFHVHRAITGIYGNATDFAEGIKSLEVFEASLINAIAEKTGLDSETVIANWFDGKDHYLTPEEAKEFGFADIVGEELSSSATNSVTNIADLKNMKYSEVKALFEELEEEDSSEDSVIEKVISLFKSKSKETNNKIDNNLNTKNTQMKQFKSAVILLTMLAMDGFKLNSDGNAELSPDELMNLEKGIEKAQTKTNRLEEEATAHAESITALEAKIAEMQAVIDKTPSTSANPKSGDNANEAQTKSDAIKANLERSKNLNNKPSKY